MTQHTDDQPSDLDTAMRKAALRLQHEQLIAAQGEYLDDAVLRWRHVQNMRAFLQAVRTRFDGAPPAGFEAWLAWAYAYCDEMDPLSDLGLKDLQAYASSLRPPPNLGPPDPEEQLWRDMGWLDPLLGEDDDGRASSVRG